MATSPADTLGTDDPRKEEPTCSASSSDWSDEEGDEYLAKALASDPYLQGTPLRDEVPAMPHSSDVAQSCTTLSPTSILSDKPYFYVETSTVQQQDSWDVLV